MRGTNKPTNTITEGLPEGYLIRAFDGRKQPFTLWKGEEVVCFASRRSDAVSAALADSRADKRAFSVLVGAGAR